VAYGPDLTIKGYVVGQFPNAPLLVALAAALAGALLEDGSTADDISRVTFYAALGVWAFLEATEGVNGFRKALGVAGLVFVVVRVVQALG
jgi:hypothetical protein